MGSTEKILVILILTVLIPQSMQNTCAKCLGVHSTLSCEEDDCDGDCFMTVHMSHRGLVYNGGCDEDEHCHSSGRRALRRQQHTKCCYGYLCNLQLKFDETPTTTAPHIPVKLTTTKTAITSPPPTTTKSTAAPTPPSLILPKGVECQVCSGPTCGLYEDGPSMTCPDDFPYCLNTVNNDSEGNKFVTKRCARYDECKTRVQQPGCLTFDPSQIYTEVMECKYCCQTSFCNRMVVPLRGTIVQ